MEKRMEELQLQLSALQQTLKHTHSAYLSRREFRTFYKFSIVILVLGTIMSGGLSLLIILLLTGP